MNGPGFQLALATIAMALCFAAWGAIAPIMPLLRGELALTETQAALLVATPVLLGSIMRIPLGVATDRFGGRRVFTALIAFLLLPVALMGLSGSYAALLGSSLLLGLAGASFAVGMPYVSRWYPPEKQGLALGLYGLGNAGTAVAGFLAPAIAGAYGWQTVFWLCLPLLAIMAVAFAMLGRDAPGPPPVSGGVIARFAALLAQPSAWLLMLFYFVSFGAFVAIGLYLPTYMVARYDLSPSDAGMRAAGFIVLATFSRPLGGALSDRFGATRVLNAVFLAVAGLAILLAFDPGLVLVTVGFLGIAFAVGLGNGAVFKLVPALFPGQTGAITGLVGAAGGLGGFFPPLLLGTIKQGTGSYAIAFMLLSEFALVCLILNLLVMERRAQRLMAPE
ncbi:MAG: MFS transporter [Candidatus Sericytochromatia bacterium]